MPRHSDYQNYKNQPIPRTEGAAVGLKPTTPDILGPFYKEGAPDIREDGSIGLPKDHGPTISVYGKVYGIDGTRVDGGTLDIWQADEHGSYDNDGFTLRGKYQIGDAPCDESQYGFVTVRPGHYKISDPGQPDEFRCSHIHVKVTADGFKPLTTQLYFADDPFDATDHWFGKDRLLKDDGSGGFVFDFVLEKTPQA